MKIKYDLTGERFDRLYVIKLDGKNKSNEYLWLCKCDCDNFVMQQHMHCGMVSNAVADASRGNEPANSWKESELGS